MVIRLKTVVETVWRALSLLNWSFLLRACSFLFFSVEIRRRTCCVRSRAHTSSYPRERRSRVSVIETLPFRSMKRKFWGAGLRSVLAFYSNRTYFFKTLLVSWKWVEYAHGLPLSPDKVIALPWVSIVIRSPPPSLFKSLFHNYAIIASAYEETIRRCDWTIWVCNFESIS